MFLYWLLDKAIKIQTAFKKFGFILFYLLFALSSAPANAMDGEGDNITIGGTNILQAGEALMPQQSIYSPLKQFRLTMQADGNLVVYAKNILTSAETAVWASGTWGNSGSHAGLVLRKNGNLEIVTWSGQKIWESGTAGNPGNYYLALKNDGTLVIHGDESVRFIARRLRNDTNQMCMGARDGNTADKTDILLWYCNMGDRSQDFVYDVANQAIRFHKSSDKCVDILNSNLSNEAKIQLFSCNGSKAQRFTYFPKTGEIKVVANPAYCLDIRTGSSNPGTGIQLYKCNNSNAQKFNMIRDGSIPVWISQIGFAKRSQPSKCIDIADNGSVPGTNVQLYDCNTSKAQLFTYNRVKGTLAKASDARMCVDLKDNLANNGSNIQLSSCGANNTAQQFDLNFAKGRFHLRRAPGKCVDVAGGNVNNNNHTNIQLYDCNESGAQNFDLTKKIQTFRLGFSEIDDEVQMWVNGTKRLSSGRFTQPFVEIDPDWLKTGDNEVEITLWNSGCGSNTLTAVFFKNSIPGAVVDRRHASTYHYFCGRALQWTYSINTSTGEVSVKGTNNEHDEL